jgi:hypothetical protein
VDVRVLTFECDPHHHDAAPQNSTCLLQSFPNWNKIDNAPAFGGSQRYRHSSQSTRREPFTPARIFRTCAKIRRFVILITAGEPAPQQNPLRPRAPSPFGGSCMSALPLTKPENISNLLHMDQEYAAPAIVADNVLQKNWNDERDRSFQNPEGFWGEYARKFRGRNRGPKSSTGMASTTSGSPAAKTNITINALDRHANSERAQSRRLHLAGRGWHRTHRHLRPALPQVCRFANGLKSLGVGKGDRVIIYMPLTIEGAIAMLACARIGAIHSVVYAGLGHTALRDRITDAQAKIVIAGDVGFRRGKTVAAEAIVDEALDRSSASKRSSCLLPPKTESARARRSTSTT